METLEETLKKINSSRQSVHNNVKKFIQNISIRNLVFGIVIVILIGMAIFFLYNFLIGALLVLFILLLIIGSIAAATLVLWYSKLYDTMNKLGEYLPLVKEECNIETECLYDNLELKNIPGENFKQKVKKTFWANLGIAFSLYLTLTYLVYAVPTTLFDFSSIQSITILSIWKYDLPNIFADISISRIAFLLTFFMIPAFLLSYRFLANPTRLWYNKNNNLSDETEFNQIKSFKESVISFYFSFIASTIILFYLSILYLAAKYNNPLDIRLLVPFSTDMDLFAYFLMIFLEITAIYVISYCEEKYFEKFQPIQKPN
jgi:hypothetical protein